MSKNKHCYYRLKLDTTNALNSDWAFPQPIHGIDMWSLNGDDIFSSEWLTHISHLGFELNNILLFYRGRNKTSQKAHVDIRAKDFRPISFAINWVIGGRGSKMNWFDIASDVDSALEDNNTTVPYKSYSFSDLKLIESCEIQSNAVLVRTDLPHSITMGSEPRWCFSTRLHPTKDLKWDEIVEILRSNNLLMERA